MTLEILVRHSYLNGASYCCVFFVQAVNMEGVSFDKFVDYHVANSGWALDKSQARTQLIVLPRSEFNNPELKKNTADSLPLEHVTRIFPILG